MIGGDLLELGDLDRLDRKLLLEGCLQKLFELGIGGFLELADGANHIHYAGDCLIDEHFQGLGDAIDPEDAVEHLDIFLEILARLVDVGCRFLVVSHLKVIKQHKKIPPPAIDPRNVIDTWRRKL